MLEDQSGLRLAAGALLGVLVLGGCKFSASATGNVNSSGDAQGDASASMQEQPPPAEAKPQEAITFREGKLDYQGVINFEYDKANLRTDQETQATLAEFKKFFEAHPTVKIEVQGHTDSRGSDDYNRDLSDRRAASVRAWLLKNGVAEDRVTSIGKGEDQPQVPEPDECNDKLPADQAPCEAPWGKNRRVVFHVTGGAEALPAPAPAAEPATVVEALPVAKPACPWLWGGHANALGPNSWVTLAGATQPGVCWLELSLGLGIGGNSADASNNTASADGSYVSFTVPLRARFWFMNRHSLIGDAGLGFTHYRISADLSDGATGTGEYTRNTTPLILHLGLGYGFRPNGAEAGPRLALAIGGLVHATKLGSSTIQTNAAFAGGPGIKTALDNETNNLDDIEPYGEISFGWLFSL